MIASSGDWPSLSKDSRNPMRNQLKSLSVEIVYAKLFVSDAVEDFLYVRKYFLEFNFPCAGVS